MKLLMNANRTKTAIQISLSTEIDNLINQGRNILILTHINPDGDAIGSQLAMASFVRSKGKNVFLVRDDEIPKNLQFLAGAEDIPLFGNLPDSLKIDTAIILECPHLHRAGKAEQLLNDAVKIINIDHHHDNDNYGDIKWVDSSISSVGEMLYELFENLNFHISESVAEQLYTAILTDTGRFRFKSTSKRTMEIAGNLVEAGASPSHITDLVYYNQEPSSIRLLGKVLNAIEFHFSDRLCLISVTQNMLAAAKATKEDTEGLIDYTLYSNTTEIGLMLKEVDSSTTKVSLRSREKIDISKIAAQFGGGGHFNASGCQINKDIETAKSELLKAIGEELSD